MARSKGARENVAKSGDTERCKNGRFQKGHKGIGGRPPAIDLRAAAEEWAAKRKVDLRQAIGEVVLAMIVKAKDGDVHAAKLVIERLCAKDGETGSDRPVVVRLVSGVPERVEVED